ncbi:MAG TPA: peptidylprolyl isomerase [Trichocoleus sp.]|jgi:parvulin-like peptidyl-prolyl isomerase
MNTILQISDREFTADQLMPLLAEYQLMPQLLKEIVIDQAIELFTCTLEELDDQCQTFFAQHGIHSVAEQEVWLEAQGMTMKQFVAPLQRQIRLEKFKAATWGNKLESHFLQRKHELDQVICSIIRHRDRDTISELYFRLDEGEQSFAELAPIYSEGAEAQTKGVMGPVELGQLHPDLAALLRTSKPGQLVKTHIAEWYIVAQVESYIPAQFDEWMQNRLLDELFSKWLQQQITSTRYKFTN